MRTLEAGNSRAASHGGMRRAVRRALSVPTPRLLSRAFIRRHTGKAGRARRAGFTLIELMVVIAIIALATAGVTVAMRDPAATQLEREAGRLAALLESARARSRASGIPVRWQPVPGGFRFDGLPRGALPTQWLYTTTQASSTSGALLLGPEPIIGAQAVVLQALDQGGRALTIATDGLRPFTVQTNGVLGAPAS